MEFRDYAAHETSSVITRLIASQANAQVSRARGALEAAARALDATVVPVGADDAVRDLVQRLEAAAGIAVQRVQQDTQKAIEAAQRDVAAARRDKAEADTRIEDLSQSLAQETARATAAEADLDATIEAHRQVEQDLAGARELLESSRAETARLTSELERESAEKAVLAADLSAARAAQARLEEAIATAEAALAEEMEGRATLQSELEAARGRLADLKEARTTLESDLEGTRAALQSAHDAAASELEARTAVQAELDSATATIATLRDAQAALESELEAARTALAASEAARAHRTLLEVAATACRELDNLTSIDALLAGLVHQMASQFARVAVFRVKAHHLEGEHAVGFDAGSDVSKLVVPLTLDSLITRAHASGTMAQAAGDDPALTPGAPFGGSPRVALAAPITLQGEIIAVLYADAEEPSSRVHDERPAFAALLVSHAGVLLGRMSQELKVVKEMREYASMLLQEAEQMFAADLEMGRPEAERRQRLKETIDCARQLYAQRAALESTAATGLLDECVAAAIGDPSTPFAVDLAAVTGSTPASRRNVS